jgi:hypothetical protein
LEKGEENMTKKLKEWRPRLFKTKDGSFSKAFAHRSSMRGKNVRSRNCVLVFLYSRWFTQNNHEGVIVPELLQQLGPPLIGAKYLEQRVRRWVSPKWAYLERKPSVNLESGRLAWGYVIGSRGVHVIEDILTKEEISDYIQLIRNARTIREGKQDDAN